MKILFFEHKFLFILKYKSEDNLSGFLFTKFLEVNKILSLLHVINFKFQ